MVVSTIVLSVCALMPLLARGPVTLVETLLNEDLLNGLFSLKSSLPLSFCFIATPESRFGFKAFDHREAGLLFQTSSPSF
jgi:hypothetical protein